MAWEKHSQAILHVANWKIALEAEKKPTLPVAAVRAVGTGVNMLQRASYAVIVDVHF